VYDNLAVGLGLTTPYGNALKWPKYWNGSHLIQEIALKTFVLQPTVSYKITDKLSVGAGLMLAVGNVELSRTIMSAADFQGIGVMLDQMLPAYYPNKEGLLETIRNNNFPPATATLEGKAKVQAGFNIGLLYDLSEKVTIGLSYRSKIKMRVNSGEAEMNYANSTVEQLMGQLGQLEVNGTRPLAVPKYDQGTFRAALPLPSNANFGVSYRPTERLELALDLQYVGWNAYDSLNVHFNETELGIAPIKAKKDYENTIIARVGAQYKATERLFLRSGVYYDQTPIQENNFNPETPGMDKLGMSAGFSFSPYENLQIDFSFLYIQGLSRDGSYTQKNVITQQPEVFSGRYKTTAVAASFGIAYCF
jgi:long-chain fatty acid transport protein